MRVSIPTALASLAAFPCTLAWGVSGHATVATIANNYLTSQASSYVSKILGSGVTMASVASWADTYRETNAGAFSEPFHFIDAEDSPPSSCSVELSRDCSSSNCIVSAISNYTSQLLAGTESATLTKEALEFVIHFLGDITQPLHCEAYELGGNEVDVTWNGESTNLHACWDTQMVEESAGGSSVADYEAWAKTLITAINSGIYESQKASWITCMNVNTASTCATQWASDSNVINCQYVLKVSESGKELSGSYYTGAKPYIAQQIAKGGYRLANWLNAIAAAAA